MLVFLVFLICIGEGLGLRFFHAYLPYFIALIPGIIFMYHSFRYNSFHLTLSPSIIVYGITAGFYAVSILFSFNKEASVEPILLFISVYLLYLYFHSYPLLSDSQIKTMIFGLCAVFIVGFLGYSFQNKLGMVWVQPQTSYQLIAPFYYPHNHLADFLGLGIIVSLYYFTHTYHVKYLLPVVIFLPFTLISFSNSAYLSIVLTGIILTLFASRKSFIKQLGTFFVLCVLFITFAIFFIGSVKVNGTNQSVNRIQKTIIQRFSFYPKPFGSTRLHYYKQALEGIIRHPLFGVGPQNFHEISRQFKITAGNFTTNVHNIFLEIGVEAGLPALIFFVLFILLRLRAGILSPSLSFFVFLYLLFNFQTDYTYKIYSLIVLCIIFAAQIAPPIKKTRRRIAFGIFAIGALVLQFSVICLLTSHIFLKMKKPAHALLFNPFNRYAYYELINEAVSHHNKLAIETYDNKLHAISSINTESELRLSDAYRSVEESQKQFKTLQTAYKLQPFLPTHYIEELFNLTKKYESQQKAERLIISYIVNRKNAMYFTADKQTLDELNLLCKKTYEKGCEEIK